MVSPTSDALTSAEIAAARLIGIDWGSTGLRSFIIGEGGVVIASAKAKLGASSMQGKDAFASTFNACLGDWIVQLHQAGKKLPVLACGMVGSKHGWIDVPYIDCPANSHQIARQLGAVADVPVSTALSLSTDVYIVPGLLFNPIHAAPDVMRGEETQIVGALNAYPVLHQEACLVLPGTHSKWANVRQGSILGFATHMTGELFAVLSQYSVLGRLLTTDSDEHNSAAFIAGVEAARDHSQAGLTHQLFAVRSLGITEKLNGVELTDYLSGLLIGHELNAGLAWRADAGLDSAPLVLIGETALCQRYQQALLNVEQTHSLVLPNTAPQGLWHIANAAQLV